MRIEIKNNNFLLCFYNTQTQVFIILKIIIHLFNYPLFPSFSSTLSCFSFESNAKT